MSTIKLSKYPCKTNLEKMENLIERLRNQNLQTDYTKILSMLINNLNELMEKYPEPTTKNFEFYILNYQIEKHINKLNKLF